MKFKKAVIVNIDKPNLPPAVWKKIQTFASKTVLLPKDSPKILQEITDADFLLVNFGIPTVSQT